MKTPPPEPPSHFWKFLLVPPLAGIALTVVVNIWYFIPAYHAVQRAEGKLDAAQNAQRDAAQQEYDSAVAKLESSILRSIVLFITGLVLGHVWQNARIKELLDKQTSPKDELEELRKDLTKEVGALSDILQIDSAREAVLDIIHHSRSDRLEPQHIEGRLLDVVNREIEARFARFGKDIRSIATMDEIEVDGPSSFEMDRQLLDAASHLVLASSNITDDTLRFWRELEVGRKYRDTAFAKVKQLAEGSPRSPGETPTSRGVRRVFIVSSRKDNRLPEVLAEARRQREGGIDAAIAFASDLPSEISDLDVLITDSAVASTTEHNQRGEVRKIVVHWNGDRVKHFKKKWEQLWENAQDPDEVARVVRTSSSGLQDFRARNLLAKSHAEFALRGLHPLIGLEETIAGVRFALADHLERSDGVEPVRSLTVDGGLAVCRFRKGYQDVQLPHVDIQFLSFDPIAKLAMLTSAVHATYGDSARAMVIFLPHDLTGLDAVKARGIDRYLVERAADIASRDAPKTSSQIRCTLAESLDFYSEYEGWWEEAWLTRPELRGNVRIEPREAMERYIERGVLVLMSNSSGLVGVTAAIEETRYGIRGWHICERIVKPTEWRHGYGAALAWHLARFIPNVSKTTLLWGPISVLNKSSIKSAEAVGRVDVGGTYRFDIA